MKKLISILLAVFLLACLAAGCDVASPEIEEGEFSFSVTYEMNGRTETVSGVYVCEYEGVSWTLDGGSGRSWIGHFKDDDLKDCIPIGTGVDGRTVDLNFGMNPDYFMGESYEQRPEPYLTVTVYTDEGMYFENDAEVIAETYGARIISYTYDEAIVNTFS